MMSRTPQPRSDSERRRAIFAVAPTLAATVAIVLLADTAAHADCTPASANNVTATCTGATTNQGGGAPGSSADPDNGYGTGVETGVTVNVGIGASVTGVTVGVALGSASVTNSGSITGTNGFLGSGIYAETNATVTNNAGGSIEGANGISANTGFANVTNSGSITGTFEYGIYAQTNATVTNNTGGTIASGIYAATGFVNVTNSGSITGSGIGAGAGAVDVINSGSITGGGSGIDGTVGVTVTNSTGATISGGQYGINAGFATVTNSGSITGTIFSGINAQSGATVTNNAGGSITGDFYGIYSATGLVTVTNSGSIAGSIGIFADAGAAAITNSGSITAGGTGIYAGANATVTNNAGGSIEGGTYGIVAVTGFANVINSGSITGTLLAGISVIGDATVINNAGASITGGSLGIGADMGLANVTNSGSITGTEFGIYGTTATVTNNVGGSITGGHAINGSVVVVTNSGNITGVNGGGAITAGIFGVASATVTNNAGAGITGTSDGIYVIVGSANVTNSGSITGGANGIYAETSATVTNNAGGSITGGDFGVYAHGAGSSVFNAGTISGGFAAIEFLGGGNTLTLGPGSVISGNVLATGADTFQLGGTGAASFDISQIDPAAQYRGFSVFNKIDSSIWTLTGTSTFAGPVNIIGGTLAVNGDITSASGVTVSAGGTLGGAGTVGTTTINGGTLAPGNSVGTLTVSGSLTLTAASTYLVQISGASSDRTNVTGTANISGTVTVDPLTRVSATTTYTIMTGGTVNGSFTTVNFLSATNSFARNARLSYVGNDVLLTVDPGLLSPNLPGNANINQNNVAAGIDKALSAGANMPAGFNGLFALTGSGLANALTQVSGETATGSQQATFDAMNLFMGVMTDPFTAGRGGNAPGASGFAAEDNASAYAAHGRKRSRAEREAYAMFAKAPPRAFEGRWNVWAAGFGGSQTTDGNATLGSNTATSRIGGVAVGADYWLSPQTVAGFALAGGGTNFSVNGAGSGRSDLFQAGAFLRHTIGSAYITAAAAYGWQDITTDRTVTVAGVDRLRAQFNANAFSGRLEGGNRYLLPWIGGIGLTPYAAAQVTAFDLPAYGESVVSGADTFALAYTAKTVTATRSEIGLRSDKSFVVGDAILTLRGRAAWAHDYNTSRTAAATFQTLPGASFVVNGAVPSHDAALTTASAEMKFVSGLSLAATFEGEFSGVTRSYAGKGVVRYGW
jgi:uncharacterized protein with beta-barrel porin domain